MTTKSKQLTMQMSSKIRIKKPVSIREKVRDVIRNDVYEGRIKEGSRLVEAQLAKQINTSRTPVREALHMLEMEGLLESIPRVGYRVKPIKWEELEELCEIRCVNEILAAKWAMERMTLKELQLLENNLELSQKNVEQGNTKSFWDFDTKFHESIALFSRSERLLELCGKLRHHMVRYRLQTLYLNEGSFHQVAIRSNKGHRKILDAMKLKDAKGVTEAIQNHLAETKQDILHYAFKDKKKHVITSK